MLVAIFSNGLKIGNVIVKNFAAFRDSPSGPKKPFAPGLYRHRINDSPEIYRKFGNSQIIM